VKRVALVTGSSRGLGREIALRLANETGGVAVHYYREKEAALNVVREIREKGCLAAAFQADLTRESQAKNMIRKIAQKFGRLDILVNCVGPILVKPWEAVTPQEWEYIFRSNLESALFCLKAALPGMRMNEWGRIINIGYHRAEQIAAFPTNAPYAAAKTSLLILTRTAAATEARHNITANMVSPGFLEGSILPKKLKISKEQLGKRADVAEAVSFLASEKASRITGTNLIVAGTWKM
jgi:3-oxoacyl-[acyl-carrier protein] reductase